MRAWFSRLIAAREKHPFRFPALFAVVCFVALARAQLELLTANKASYDGASVLNNIAFYLLSAYLYSAIACLLTRKRLESVAGIVAFGVFLGVFPPLLDTLLSGPGHGYYRYPVDGFATWQPTLFSPRHYSTGEGVTLWLLVIALPVYIGQATHSWLKALLALVLSYAAATFMAVGPSTFALQLAERALPLGRGAWLMLLSTLQLALAQGCYLIARPKLARRLLPRLLHALPFVTLVLLGSSLARLFAPALSLPGGLAMAVWAALLMLQLCAVALVQNDAHDAAEDGRAADIVSKDDAHFFTTSAVLGVLVMLDALPSMGIPLALFLCASTIYSYDFYRAKRFFPANYKCEGVWGWSAFVLGGTSALVLRPDTRLPGAWLLASLGVFGGFSLFNAFKDYKDIRADAKARVQTLYTLARKRGVRLRALHNRLRVALMLAALLPAAALAADGRVALAPLGLLTLVTVIAFGWALGLPPGGRSVKAYLLSVACFLMMLCATVESGLVVAAPAAQRRAPPPPTSAAVAAKPTTDAPCTPHGLWRDHVAELPFMSFRQVRVGDYSGAHHEGCFALAQPTTVEEVQQLVSIAARIGAPIRIRGAGHSMNASSLPGPDELLLSTAKLDELRFETRGTVIAQAGLQMHAVEQQVRAYGLHVPVVNDGMPAPSVGGYVAAGGLGQGSTEYGGFWENVAALTVVDGRGQLRRVAREDEDFLWFFGAMGQLGVVVEAELDVIATAGAAVLPEDPYASRKRVRVGQRYAWTTPGSIARIWFTLLVRPAQITEARAELQALEDRYRSKVRMLTPYTYAFRDRGHVPPLFFGQRGALTAVGIWAEAGDQTTARAIDRDVAALCARRGYRRYIQTELTRGPDAYESYFGSRTYAALRERKRRMDPEELFNRGTFFAYPGPAASATELAQTQD